MGSRKSQTGSAKAKSAKKRSGESSKASANQQVIAANPRKANKPLLIVSMVLVAIWFGFLAYVAWTKV